MLYFLFVFVSIKLSWFWKAARCPVIVFSPSFACGKHQQKVLAHALSDQLMQPWLDSAISTCQPFKKCNWVSFLGFYWFGQVWSVRVSGRKNRLILWVKVAKAVCESCHGFKVLRVWQRRKSWRIFLLSRSGDCQAENAVIWFDCGKLKRSGSPPPILRWEYFETFKIKISDLTGKLWPLDLWHMKRND